MPCYIVNKLFYVVSICMVVASIITGLIRQKETDSNYQACLNEHHKMKTRCIYETKYKYKLSKMSCLYKLVDDPCLLQYPYTITYPVNDVSKVYTIGYYAVDPGEKDCYWDGVHVPEDNINCPHINNAIVWMITFATGFLIMLIM